jgi:multidrug resistance efflux pump
LIAPQVAGYIETVSAQDFMKVKAGDLLFSIDSRRLRQGVSESVANVDAKLAALANNRQKMAQAKADVAFQEAVVAHAEAVQTKAASDEARARLLVKNLTVSKSEDEAAIAALKEATAEVAQAKAGLENSRQAVEAVRVNEQALQADVEAARAKQSAAEIDLGYAAIRAPQDGELSEVGVRKGQYVVPGAALTFLVPYERWVIANFKEAQTRDMVPGQMAWFSVDALGSGYICGKVDQIAPATSAQFSALKPDNATGNFTKVPQRIPVRIAIDPGQEIKRRLSPGMSAVVFVDTSGSEGGCPK